MAEWTIPDAIEKYNIAAWGANFFSVNEGGNITVHPTGDARQSIDLKQLVDEIQERGIQLPLLIRFSDILRSRVHDLCTSFQRAIDECGYKSVYRGVYPIKVNQQREVVKAIVDAARPFHFGLEAGSKPELLTTIAVLDDPEALIVCNGYKDEAFVELALLACKVGKKIFLVVEKLNEVELILKVAERLQVKPNLGIRLRLSARGSGRWESSGGDRSKFGLGPVELMNAVEILRARDMLECLQLVHFHLGSQITSIHRLKRALTEGARYYVELKGLGANLQYLDVGGGLAVDYDGSRTNFASSANYTMQEYANDVVYQIMTICDESEVAHPVIISESGRALTAQHSVLIFNVLGVTVSRPVEPEKPNDDEAPSQIVDLWDSYQNLTSKNYLEAFHDIQHAREQILNMFNLGFVDLRWRAYAEAIYRAANHKIYQLAKNWNTIPDEIKGMGKLLADIYFGNFSIFQSVPDAWAIDHLFPTAPIHRLDEPPTCSGILADITCDSDGCLDRFIGLRDTRDFLPLHAVKPGEEYLLGIFLVGAYQEILGDLHNLFGDNNAVQVALDREKNSYRIEHVEYGDTVSEVLSYVEHNKDGLVGKFRQSVERAVSEGRVTLPESRYILEMYRNGFEGYTYIEE